nr:MAG TPA: hypothetical protein [Caudoviricetes sp.]
MFINSYRYNGKNLLRNYEQMLKKFFHFTNKNLPTFRNFAQIKTTVPQDFVYSYKNIFTLLTNTPLYSIIVVSKGDTP